MNRSALSAVLTLYSIGILALPYNATSKVSVRHNLLQIPSGTDNGCRMLWTFCRQGQQVCYEIRLATDGPEFELVLRFANEPERVERFADSVALNRRALELEEKLLGDGWWLAADPRR